MVEYVPTNKSVSGRPGLVVSRHFLNTSGQFMGGVLGVIELERMKQWLESFEIASNDSVSLIDNSQVLLARRPAMNSNLEKQMKSEAEIDFLIEQSKKTGIAISIDTDGLERLFGISKIEDFPLSVVYGYEKLATLKQWRKRAIDLSVGYCTLLLLAGFVVLSHITRIAST